MRLRLILTVLLALLIIAWAPVQAEIKIFNYLQVDKDQLRIGLGRLESMFYNTSSNCVVSRSMEGRVFLWDLDNSICTEIQQGNSLYKAFPKSEYMLKAVLDLELPPGNDIYPDPDQNKLAAMLYDSNYNAEYFAVSLGGKAVAIHRWSDGKRVQFYQAPSEIKGVRFSPSGNYLALRMDKGRDKFAKIFLLDPENGKVFSKLWMKYAEGPWGKNFITWSPDERKAAVPASKRSLIIYNIPDGKAVREVKIIGDKEGEAAWSPDGKLIAVNYGGSKVGIIDAGSGRAKLELTPTFMGNRMPTWGTSQLLISTTPSGTIYIWDVSSEKFVGRLEGHTAPPAKLLFSPDGTELFIALPGSEYLRLNPQRQYLRRLWPDFDPSPDFDMADNYDVLGNIGFFTPGHLYLFDLMTGKSEHIYNIAKAKDPLPEYYVLSPDSKRAMTGDKNGELYLWDLQAEDGKMLKVFTTSYTVPVRPQWSKDSTLLAYIDRVMAETPKQTDDPAYTLWIRIVDGKSGIMMQSKKVLSEKIQLRWSPDGTRVAILEKKQGVTIYQPNTAGDREYKFDVANAGYEISPEFLAENNFMFARGKNVISMSLPDGKVKVAYRADDAITAMTASTEGYIAVADQMGRIIITLPKKPQASLLK